jgi:hypothetical protein
MNDDQRNRVNAYVRWGLTQIQAENWILSDIYPGHTIMKRCRKRRWAEKQGRDKNEKVLRKKADSEFLKK